MSDEQQGQPASGAAQQAASLSHEARVSDLTIGQLTAILRSEAGRVAAGGLAGAHANSGPPGFVNGGGHANFDPRVARPGNVGGLAGVHVNSGPPGFVNGGGHANFDPRVARPGNVGGLAGMHVNSGPPGFVNGGGHANFDPRSTLAGGLRAPGTQAGSHANSGPPGFVNGGGHANFDPGGHANSGPPGFVNGGGHANFDPEFVQAGNSVINVTLPGGRSLGLPASGPINMRIGGVQITR